jgi:hypothetical protein
MGCGQTTENEQVGGAEVSVHALAASSIISASLTVSGDALPKPRTEALLKGSGQWGATLGGLPAAKGYTFTATAVATDGTVYSGSTSSVEILAKQSILVQIVASNPSKAFKNAAPVIDAVTISSTSVAPGALVTLAVAAHDPDAGDTLTYAWATTAADGFADTSAANTTWTAPTVEGTYDVTITVQDNHSAKASTMAKVKVAAVNGRGSAAVGVTFNSAPVVSSVATTPGWLVKGVATAVVVQASDPDGNPLSYNWTSACAGTFGGNTSTTTFTLADSEIATACTLTVAVGDGTGFVTTGEVTVPTGQPAFNAAPDIVASLQSATSANAGDVVTFSVEASDPEGGALTFAWTGPTGTLSTPTTDATSSLVTFAVPGTSGPWQVTATVTDAQGAGAQQAFIVKAKPWKFGVMSDTQWPTSPDSKNPNVAVNVINHLNQEFINQGVKFVIQVGDLTDKPSTANTTARVENLDIRAAFAQSLYDAGIGFYPLRGNHEDKPGAGVPAGTYALEFERIFPQTQTGLNNLTPADALVSSNTFATYYPPHLPPTTPSFGVCGNFVSEPSMEGLTYSFDCGNARFVLIDQFTKPAGTSHSNLDATDVAWIGGRFSSRAANTHAFSFAHKGLVTENHADNLFNSTNPTASQASRDLMESFMQQLVGSGVRYHMGGHDHMHNRAIVSSPNTGTYKVQNIIAASDSYKFYIPPAQTTFNTQSTFRALEKPIAQEIFAVGYYIFTVDGAKVTVDYYAMPNGCGGDCDETTDVIPYAGNTPTTYNQPNGPGSAPGALVPTVVAYADPVPFTKHETFGYSLNGIEKVVDQGASYVLTDDTSRAIANGEPGYLGTTAKILSGTNGSTGKDYNLRALAKSVNTGWAPAADGLASDVFTLWGMADSLATRLTPVNSSSPQYVDYSYVVPDTFKTDTYVLSMTFNGSQAGGANSRLASKDGNGNWVNAVTLNVGGTATFVAGPWVEGYALGTYGVDVVAGTVWAVVNHAGDFGVSRNLN